MRQAVEPARLERAPDGLPAYSWQGTCRACGRQPATDPHHIVPRSATGGPVDWLVIDGWPVPNVAGVCRACHDAITEGRAAIVYAGRARWDYLPPEPGSRPRPLRPLAAADAALRPRSCPTCGHRLPRPNPYPRAGLAGRRRRGRYTLQVPRDAQENGRDVLDTLTAEVAEQLGMVDADASSARYYAVCAALVLALQSRA